MNLMITKDTAQSSRSAEAVSTPLDVLVFAVADCEFGKVLVARSTKGVCAILLGDTVAELKADLVGRFPQSTTVENADAVTDDVAKVLRYMEKPSNGLRLTLDMRGTPFQRRVWEKVKAVSIGRAVSYSELARWISPLANPRAVARACVANSIALAIPCHRIVRRNGDLAGYRWGIERKRSLLQKEAAARRRLR